MADFLNSEAEESDGEQLDELIHAIVRKLNSDDEEDDGEEVNDLIDDNPIEEDSDNASDRKRKKSDDEDFEDVLEDDDYDLLEENLGVKVQKKRRRIIQDKDSDDEGTQDGGYERNYAPRQIFEDSDNEEQAARGEREGASEESGGDSEDDGFIVDDEDRPLTDSRKRRKPIFADHTLQAAQDIFGVDFDYNDFEKYGDEYHEEEDDDYEDEGQLTSRIATKDSTKRRKPKSIYEIYEPIELERAGFTDEDNRIRSQDIPERMQLRTVPVVPGTAEELDEEAEWIYGAVFKNRPVLPQQPVTLNPAEPKGPGVPRQPTGTAATWGNDEDEWNCAPTQSVPTQPIPTAPMNNVVVSDEDGWGWDEPPAPTSTVASQPPPVAPAPSIPFPATSNSWLDDTLDNASSILPVSLGNQAPRHQVAEEVKRRFISKIRATIEFMRNQYLEVPFIAFYRKEYIQPELNINDLWMIYREDARFCQLRARKLKLIALFEKMREFQASLIMSKPDDPIPEKTRMISEDDMEHLQSIQTHEELNDAYMQFSLYYQQDVASMREHYAKKRNESGRLARQVEVDPENPTQELPPTEEEEEVPEAEEDATRLTQIKRKVAGTTYGTCVKNGIAAFARKFGLSPYKFAQNLRDNYQRFELDQDPLEPLDAAIDFCTAHVPTPEDVVKAGKYMMAMQISKEPVLRRAVREVLFEQATISVEPTKKGLKEIDENHPLYTVKYLTGKPAREMTGDMFVRLTKAEEDGLLNIKIGESIKGMTNPNYVDELKQLCYKDEFTRHVQLWNDLRAEMIQYALETLVFPELRKELRARLVTQAKNNILEAAAVKLRTWIEVKPYEPNFSDYQEEDENGDWLTTRGIKVLSIAYVPDFQQAAFACFVGVDGDPSDYLRLPNITKNVKSKRTSDKAEKEVDLEALGNFIRVKKPHVIVIGGESREALMIQEELKRLCVDISQEEQVPKIKVEIVDNQLAKVFANSIKGMNDFRDYPPLLREAVSLARKMQDPLIEYSQLCTPDDEILCLRYHPLQDQVPREELLEYLQFEFVNRVNEVGVDMNRAITFPYTANILQFVCGLGPRKSMQLIKALKQNNHRLENRTQLITRCHMGAKVFINCSGFIKIDTNSLGDSTDEYVEALDSTRVHPETYEWARKMAVDAMDLEDEDTPAIALEQILLTPERLNYLDLGAFAKELARQGFGNKITTLHDIRRELDPAFADHRVPYQTPSSEELFNMLTKETPETLYHGKLIVATVIGVAYKKPPREQLDSEMPVRNPDTGMWKCLSCLKNDFPDLTDVWNHCDANLCQGQPVGVQLRLDNGIHGFIPIAKLSDKQVTNPYDRVRTGQNIHCRITRINVDRFSVECTSRTSDLVDAENDWRPVKDLYYDHEAEEAQRKREVEVDQIKQRVTYVKRIIIHPSFKNIAFRESEKFMQQSDQGDVVIRPSSKGEDHLTATWKVCDGIYQHVDIKEQRKENPFSLGQSLWIGDEEFEDLDEIIVRYVNPMASYARDLLNYKYFKAFENRQAVDEYLTKEKERDNNKIHYIIYPLKEFPGKFILAYLPTGKVLHEFIGLKSEGFLFRQKNFENLNLLLKWFKEHYRDPPPQAKAVAPARTPSATPGNHADATASFYAGQTQGQNQVTPHYLKVTPAQAYTPYCNFPSTPYTPTAQTPHMTPYQQPTFPTTPAQRPLQGTPGFAHPASTTPAHSSQQQRIPAGSENLGWRKAAEAWASASSQQTQRNGQSDGRRHDEERRRTPVTRDTDQIIIEGIEKTKQMSNSAHNLLPDLNHKYRRGGRDRDSFRSTPKNNFSPRSMSMTESSLGDETPGFDEH